MLVSIVLALRLGREKERSGTRGRETLPPPSTPQSPPSPPPSPTHSHPPPPNPTPHTLFPVAAAALATHQLVRRAAIARGHARGSAAEKTEGTQPFFLLSPLKEKTREALGSGRVSDGTTAAGQSDPGSTKDSAG